MKLNDNNTILYLKEQGVLTDCFTVKESKFAIGIGFKYEFNAAYHGGISFKLYNISIKDIELMESMIKGKYSKYSFAKKKDKEIYLAMIEDFNKLQRNFICNLDLYYGQFKSAKERDYSNDSYWHKQLFMSIGQIQGLISNIPCFHFGNMKLSEGIEYINNLIEDSEIEI